MYIFEENTSKYCSQIIVVHVHANGSLKSSPSVSQYYKQYQTGSYSKKSDKHAADCSKAVCWGVK